MHRQSLSWSPLTIQDEDEEPVVPVKPPKRSSTSASNDKSTTRKTRASPAQGHPVASTRPRRGARGRGGRGGRVAATGPQRSAIQTRSGRLSEDQELVPSPQMPFHNHGMHSGLGIYEDPHTALGEGWMTIGDLARTWWLTNPQAMSTPWPATRQHSESTATSYYHH